MNGQSNGDREGARSTGSNNSLFSAQQEQNDRDRTIHTGTQPITTNSRNTFAARLSNTNGPLNNTTASPHSSSINASEEIFCLSSFLVDQVEKIQENVHQISKEQDLFHQSTNAKIAMMETKFDTLTNEMKSLLGFFHEVVGVMNGARAWTSSHPTTNTAISHETSGPIVGNQNKTFAQATNTVEKQPHDLTANVRNAFNSTVTESLDRDEHIVSQSRLKREPLTDKDLLRRIGDGHIYVREKEKKDKPINVYRLNRKLESVADVAQEYFHGLQHQPSVQSLDARYGTSWRKTDRSFYSKRMTIINKIKHVKENPGSYDLPADMTLSMATRVIENIRLGNNTLSKDNPDGCIKLSLTGLYTYFQKKQDIVSDYSLILREEGKTRQEIALRKRYGQIGHNTYAPGSDTSDSRQRISSAAQMNVQTGHVTLPYVRRSRPYHPMLNQEASNENASDFDSSGDYSY